MGSPAKVLEFKDASRKPSAFPTDAGNDGLFSFLGRSLWEKSLSGMALSDENGEIVAVNPSFLRILNLSEEDIVSKPFWTVWGNDRDPRLLQRAYTMRFNAERFDQMHEHRLMLPDGSVLILEVSGHSFESEDRSRLLFTKIRDMSQIRDTERNLRESEANYSSLFHNSVQPMFQTSSDGTLINVNHAFLTLLGFTSLEELQQLNVQNDIYVNPADRPRLLRLLRKNGSLKGVELRVRQRNGNILTVREHSRAVRDRDGNVLLYEGILEDVTEQKDMQRKLDHYIESLKTSEAAHKKLNAEKNKLMSILSHDLRSPFTGILGFTEVLQDDYHQLSDKDRLEYIRFVHESAEQQLDLLNHLLDWSRFESGRYTKEQLPVDLSTLLRDCVSNSLGNAKSKHITLQANVPDGIEVIGDKILFVQLFNNLIANALKFTPEGGTVSIEPGSASDQQWTIVVRDTGIGIPEDDIQKLFKVEEKYTRKGLRGEPGTGLGLPIVAEIVEMHAGSISVESVCNEGASFTIRLPKKLRTNRKKVVVADDDKMSLKLHSHYVRRLLPGVEVLEAKDGEQTLALAQEPDVVLVLSDYMMPMKDGYEVLKGLRSREATKNIPVVMITGDGSAACFDTLLLAGATEVVKKPIRKAQLESILEKVLHGSEDLRKPATGGSIIGHRDGGYQRK